MLSLWWTQNGSGFKSGQESDWCAGDRALTNTTIINHACGVSVRTIPPCLHRLRQSLGTCLCWPSCCPRPPQPLQVRLGFRVSGRATRPAAANLAIKAVKNWIKIESDKILFFIEKNTPFSCRLTSALLISFVQLWYILKDLADAGHGLSERAVSPGSRLALASDENKHERYRWVTHEYVGILDSSDWQ